MLRKLALSLAIAGAMSSTTAQALGLGEIQIKSALNEPLRAEIQLLQARQLSPQQVQPRMAGIDEFALAGIEKLRFLTDVQFNVQIRPDGNGVIYLSSAVPVKEPFLNFLVEVNWPSGRLVREYTVLLDPPVYDPTPATVAAQPPKIRSEAMAAAPQPQPQPAAPSKPVSNIQTRADGKSEIYVDVNDTLWHIAQQNRPSDSISEAQMMLAIQRKNPGAFSNGNVNQLKAGVVLKMPTMEEAKMLTPQQAKEEFWRQTAVWKQNTGKSAKKPQLDSADKGDVSVKTAAPADPVAESGELKIVASASESESAAMADGQSGEMVKADDSELVAKNTQLETDLSAALETVDQIQRENQELSGRVDALAQQMESLQRLLELKDQQLAALQAELDAAKKQQLDAELAAQQAAESGLVPTIMKVLKDFGLYIAAGGAGLLALIAGLIFFLRRRKNKEEEAGSELEQAVADAEADIGEVADVAEEAVAADAEPVADTDADADAPDEAEELVAVSEDVDLDDLEDLTELDLEMDLDDSFAENPLEETDADPLDETIDDQEFDLGLGDDDLDADLAELDIADVEEAVEPAAVAAATDSADDEFDLDLDMDIDEPFTAAAEQPEADDLSGELAGAEVDDALDAILDESNDASVDDVLAEIDDDELEFTAEPVAEVAEDEIADLDDVLAEAEGDDLEFTPQALPEDEPEAVAEAVADDVDELEFDLSGSEEDEDLVDLDSLLNDAPPEEPVAAKDESVDIDDLMADLQSAEELPEDEDSDMVSLDELLGESSEAEAASPVPEHVAVHPEVESLLEEAVAETDEVVLDEQAFAGSSAADDLEATFSQDLDADLDSELEALLSGDDSASAAGGDDKLDGISMLDGADEVETKLDLARAYIDMEDVDGAKDILAEILQEGSDNQKQEANSLLESLV